MTPPLALSLFHFLLGCFFRFLAIGPIVLLLELLNPASGIDKLHLAGEERMAGRANFDGDIFPRAARDELVAAAAGDGGFLVIGMNAFFHGLSSDGAAGNREQKSF